MGPDGTRLIGRLTTVGRTIDLTYPTNRAIAVLTGLAMVSGTLFQLMSGAGWFQSLVWGVNAGIGVFLTWALCRELDPDHAMSAFVAVALGLLCLLHWGLPRLGVAFWLILVARVVSRSTGLLAGILDSLAVPGLGIWLSLDGNWAYGAISVLALFLDSWLRPRARRQLVLAGLAAVATAAAAVVSARAPGIGTRIVSRALIGLIPCILFLPVILSARHLESVGDRSGVPLEPRRVQAAQVLALAAGFAAAIVGGIPAIGALAPLWAALLGASAHWMYRVAKP